MRAHEFLIESDKIQLPDDVVKAFTALGEAQRGAPEQAMLRIQHKMAGGVLNPVVEHIGDLTHRMSHMAKYGSFGYDMFADKVVKTLSWLTSAYGFEREVEENIKNNAKYKDMEPEQLKAEIDKTLENYANEHKKLPVYNKLQWVARQAAIDVGHKDFSSAVSNLQYLKHIAKDVDRYNEEASKFYRAPNGQLLQYKPGMKLKENNEKPLTDAELKQIESALDKIWATFGIDIVFSKHWKDRVNDIRNRRQITANELMKIFNDAYKKHGKKIAQQGPDFEGVLKDISSHLNIPFTLEWDRDNEELDLIAKTVMRKDNFVTKDPEFSVT